MKWIVLMFMILAFAADGCERSGNMTGELRSLVEAERRFARTARAQGIRAAFLVHLAEDAIIFRPHPVNGRQWYLDQAESEALLSWEPVFADIAAAGDLGCTTGPWWYSEEGAGIEPNVFGEYVSVWRKRPGRKWEVVIDVGTVHEKPESADVTLTMSRRDRREHRLPTGDARAELEGLLSADRRFSAASVEGGIVSAYEAFAADGIRFYRTDELPVLGKSAVCTVLRGENRRVSSQSISGAVSRSGDLGYTYGTGETVGSQPLVGAEEKSSYLRIWIRASGGSWKIALDISNPVPPPPDTTGE